jgi:O-methyltransferase
VQSFRTPPTDYAVTAARESLSDRLKLIIRGWSRSSRLLSNLLDMRMLRQASFLVSSAFEASLGDSAKVRAILAVRKHTGMSYELLSRLYDLTKEVNHRQLAGSLVQCGVSKGGGAGILVAASTGFVRDFWLFDSWEGLPPPLLGDRTFSGTTASERMYSASVSEVQAFLTKRLNATAHRMHFEKGLFESTIPHALESIGPIALLDVDCGLYDSTSTCLRLLASKVVPQGFVIIEDYNYWTGAKLATDEFLSLNTESFDRLLETGLTLYLERVE